MGETHTRAGLTGVYSYADVESGPNNPGAASNITVTGNAWANPANILTGQETTCTPGDGSDALFISAYAFNMPSTITPTGVIVAIHGRANSAVTLTVQLTIAGQAVGTPKMTTMPTTDSTLSLGGLADAWGAMLTQTGVNGEGFGVRITASTAFPLATVAIDSVTLDVGHTTANANFNFITNFEAQDGTSKNLSLDANGNFWVEDVTNHPGVLTLAMEGITPGSFANGVNGPDVEYLAFNDLTTGSDLPRLYTPNWIDRISQVGPGAAPVFTPLAYSGDDFPIVNITQPTAHSRGFSYFLQSSGPGSTSPGNVVTVYYSDSTLAGPDTDLETAFNSGNATYIYTSFTGAPVTQGPYTVQVTSVGLGSPPGQPRQFYYFTYVLPTSAYTYYQGSGHAGYTANYQRTLSTLTTSVPVPGLTVGNQATITGTSVAAYNTNWAITQALNSGSLAITQTSLTAGVATYSYTVVSGANPTSGKMVTITNTLNADGSLNGVNLVIDTSTGGSVGTFTITGFSAATDYPAEAEDAQGTTAGTQFCFDPGLLTLGTSTSPIYGTSTGGNLVFGGSTQYIAAGTKQGVVFFITHNGYWTCPSPPVTFTIPENTSAIQASQIPIGPPNVVARGIAFTESGANGVPGANFFTIPIPVQYIVQGTTYTATSLLINDNTTTTATFNFPEATLLSAEAIDVQGNNLFNLIEIGNPGWIKTYASRNFYGLCQNKIQNFLNLSFDGGYRAGQPAPLGWTTPDQYGRLLPSPLFGNSYYIANTSGDVLETAGLISQGAFEDFYKVPIINANVGYSVRVTARCPSAKTTGNLVVSLTANGFTYGAYTLPFADMTTSHAIYTGTLLTTKFETVPADLMLNVYASEMEDGSDVEIDRIEVFNTAIPVLTTTVYASYVNNLEAVDGTNQIIISQNPQPIYGASELYDTLYFHKGNSMYSTQAAANLEPAYWNVSEVSQKAGACGMNAYDSGEQWIVEACRNGLYLFSGGQPGKITQEIYQIWDAINWSAGNSIWVRNDVVHRRLFVGIPLPTPNFWLPDAPVNAAPSTPNVILMLNYQGIDSGEGLKTEAQMHTTMFGTLNAMDMRRKWTLWQIPSPYGSMLDSDELYLCNGKQNSKVYKLDETATTDDGETINSLYTTYGFVNDSKVAQAPMLGHFRKRWRYMTLTASGSGTMNVRLLPNVLLGPGDSTTGYNPWTVPGGFVLTDPATQDREATCNFVAQRVFMEFSTAGAMNLSRVILMGARDVWNALTGQK